ncbi:hypothetical protein [Falsiroseomonas sp.]|uniref:hypothetical protein n=1 Tax=Falsiroseomonas sp. TaxID=2870721 RepID=UPI0034A405ED
MRRIAATSALLLPLAGCGQPQVPVAQVWAGAVSQYALQPIFPMREGVQPGDVYVIADHDAFDRQSAFRPRSLWVAALPGLRDELQRIAEGRLQMPLTDGAAIMIGDESAPKRAPSLWPQPAHPATTTLHAGSSAGLRRLGLAAMPDVAAKTSFTAGAAAGAPVLGPLKAALGLDDSRSVTIRPVGVEVLSLPLTSIDRMRAAGCAAERTLDALVTQAAQHVEPRLAGAMPERAQLAARTNARVMVPSQVYFVRAIDFVFDADTALVAEVTAQRAEARRREAAGAQGTTPPAAAAGAAPPPPAAAAPDAAARALFERLAGRQVEGLVPATASVTFVSDQGLVLRQIFQQPLAFAVSGPSYAVVGADGGWASFCGGAQPTSTGGRTPAGMAD